MTVTAVRLEFWNVFWAGLAEGAGPVEDRAAEALGGMAEADCRDVCLSFFECKRKYEWKCVSKRISECKYECKYFRKVYLKILKRILFKCRKTCIFASLFLQTFINIFIQVIFPNIITYLDKNWNTFQNEIILLNWCIF
jgi:hypothetical protein